MCVKENIDVIPIPGACAVVAALSASGLETDEFTFGNFPDLIFCVLSAFLVKLMHTQYIKFLISKQLDLYSWISSEAFWNKEGEAGGFIK